MYTLDDLASSSSDLVFYLVLITSNQMHTFYFVSVDTKLRQLWLVLLLIYFVLGLPCFH